MSTNQKTLIGALIAGVLAVAVYYGAISRQTADNFQNQANQTLGTSPPPTAPQQPVPPASPNPTTQAPSPAPPQASAPAPQQ